MEQFDLSEAIEEVMAGGPWMMFDNYLVVREWMCVFGVPHLAVLRRLVSSDASCEMRKKIIDPSSEKKLCGVRQRLWGKWVAEVRNLAR
ncbi:hypothetical protein JHK84_042852 [Glycine max]|nr:hypothetical protein JHK86_042633 [Glycine max]KAG5116739.1 hypothetical protein JHK84_042852 [Glycine max]